MISVSNDTAKDICYLDELIIQGMTTKGIKFRPSDWVDRLCGMLASFDRQKMVYSNYLRPLVYDNMNCVAIKKHLKEDAKDVFAFIMQFAKDNDLKVVDCASFKDQIENDAK